MLQAAECLFLEDLWVHLLVVHQLLEIYVVLVAATDDSEAWQSRIFVVLDFLASGSDITLSVCLYLITWRLG